MRVQGTLPLGHVLSGRYQITGVVGVGMTSAVYQARDLRFPNMTRLVAVKEMIREAEAISRQNSMTACFRHKVTFTR